MASNTCPICRKHVMEYRDAVLEREAMRKERDAAVEALSDRRDQQLEGFLEVEQANERLRAKVAELRAEVERLRALLVKAVALIEQACQDSTCVDYEDPGCFFCGIPVGSTYVTFGEDDTETEHVHEHGEDCDARPWLIDAGNALAKLNEASNG